MKRKEFKKKYLTDAFFFIDNEEMFIKLQSIGIEFGLKDPIGGDGYISYDMHDVLPEKYPVKLFKVATNLTFFPDNRYQKSGFYVKNASYGDPKNYKKFLSDYDSLQ